MTLTKFKDKLEWSETAHKNIAWWYGANFKDYEIITSPLIQRYADIDLALLDNDEKFWWVEEKHIPNNPFKCIAVEVWQSTKWSDNPNKGWVQVSRADVLAWFYHPPGENSALLYWLSMPALQDYYSQNKDSIKHIKSTTGACYNTHPINALIDWSVVKAQIGFEYYEIEYKEID
jgi:hypothetical protein